MDPQIPSHHVYRSGERWKYKAPPGQEDSRLVVLGAEEDEQLGWIVHLSIEGIQIPASKTKMAFVSRMMHVPVSLVSFERELLAEDKARFSPVVFPNEGYEIWKDHRGGVWTTPISDIVKRTVLLFLDRD